jgi:chorismate synthase
MKIERDRAEILSGVRHGLTIGSPVALVVENKDWANWQDVMAVEPRELDEATARRLRRPRPGHADLAGGLKYGARDLRDVLERASARETAARVACGALARLLLAEFGVEIRSHVAQLGGVPDAEMWDVFNMGCGFVAVVPGADADEAAALLAARHPGSARIGTVTDRAGAIERPAPAQNA